MSKQILILIAVLTSLFLGCNKTPTVSMQSSVALNDLEKQSGITLPVGSVVLQHDDGGGREQSWQFYQWTVMSVSPITMPVIKTVGVKDYLTPPLDVAIKFIESRVPDKKVLGVAQIALRSEWETNGFEYKGTLVRTDSRDYFVCERFKKK